MNSYQLISKKMRVFILSKNMNYILPLFLWLMVSCDDPLLYDLGINDFNPKVNVNCTFTSDSVWQVYLSKTSSIFSDETWEPVSKAIITISDNVDKTINLKYYTDGKYTSTVAPVPGKRYTLKVIIQGFDTIEVSDIMPNPPVVDTVICVDSINFQDNQYFSRASVYINDSALEKDYYMIFIYQQDENSKLVPLLLQSDDVSIENMANKSIIGRNNIFRDELLVNDEIFDGKTHAIDIKYTKELLDRDIYIVIRRLSANLYEYLLSYSKYSENTENPFSEPINVYSNIENGIGIFGGYNSVIHIIH